MKSLDKIYRLHDILKHARSYIPKNELLEKMGCSDSTLEKIIQELREIYGAPLVYEERYSGYKYVFEDGETFELPGIWFSGDELAAWFAIHQLISEVPDGVISSTLTRIKTRIAKIASKVSLTPAEWAQKIKIVPINFRKPRDIVFRIVVEGLIRERCLHISYLGINKPESERVISPIQLVRYRDNWYLYAYCHECKWFREFELSRIKSVKLTNQKIEHIPGEVINEIYHGSYGIFTGKADKKAVIKFSGIAAKIVSEEIWHKNQDCKYDPESGICILTIPYHTGSELIRDVLRWGDLAEIVEPSELRTEIINTINASIKNYQK